MPLQTSLPLLLGLTHLSACNANSVEAVQEQLISETTIDSCQDLVQTLGQLHAEVGRVFYADCEQISYKDKGDTQTFTFQACIEKPQINLLELPKDDFRSLLVYEKADGSYKYLGGGPTLPWALPELNADVVDVTEKPSSCMKEGWAGLVEPIYTAIDRDTAEAPFQATTELVVLDEVTRFTYSTDDQTTLIPVFVGAHQLARQRESRKVEMEELWEAALRGDFDPCTHPDPMFHDCLDGKPYFSE